MVRKIVAIGGGEMGRTKVLEDGSIKQYPMETISIDEEIIRLSGKKTPKLLLIPTASKDSPTYFEAVQNYFGKKLGCDVSVLNLINTNLSKSEIEKIILSTDIVYVGGGYVPFMLEQWKKYNVDKVLKKAYEKGIVLSGVSAGAVCWFEWYDNTDDRELDPNWTLDFLPGLGFVKGFAVPHWDDLLEEDKQSIKALLHKKRIQPAWALDNCSAVVLEGEKARVLSSKVGKEAVLIL